MRLHCQEVNAIKTRAVAVYGPDVVVRLFGSRTDDHRRGGDIDLHLEVPAGCGGLAKQLEFLIGLQDLIGEQKVDVVVHECGSPLQPIDDVALAHGVEL